jgi:ERCC4-type nuclease
MLMIIDYREQQLIKLIKEHSESDDIFIINDTKIYYKIENLGVGDIIIKESDSILLMIERKTTSDLCSSILDGRFRQQKDRMLESISDPTKILYIIERNKCEMNKKTSIAYKGALQNLILKHHYKLLYTDSILDTLEQLCSIYKKYSTKTFLNNVSSTPITLIKRSDKINQSLTQLQLSVIPGISFTTAKIITEKYPTMSNLINEYNLLDSIEEKLDMLSKIQLSEKRTLGKALSKRIYNSLFEPST